MDKNLNATFYVLWGCGGVVATVATVGYSDLLTYGAGYSGYSDLLTVHRLSTPVVQKIKRSAERGGGVVFVGGGGEVR